MDDRATHGKLHPDDDDCNGAAALRTPPKGDEFIVEILGKLSQMTAASTESPFSRIPPSDRVSRTFADVGAAAAAARPHCRSEYERGYKNAGDNYASDGWPPIVGFRYPHGYDHSDASQFGAAAAVDSYHAATAPKSVATAALAGDSSAYATGCSLATVASRRIDQAASCWVAPSIAEEMRPMLGGNFKSSYDAVSDRDAFTLLASRVRRGGNQTHLWEFLLELLTDAAYASVVSWENEEGTFCIKNPTELASIWGHRRKRQNMTYEKLSRSLRHYYDKKILRKVPKRKYTYKFNCREILKTYDVPPAFRYHHQFRKRAAVALHPRELAVAPPPPPQRQQLQPPPSPPSSSSPLSALRAASLLPSPLPGSESMDSSDSATTADEALFGPQRCGGGGPRDGTDARFPSDHWGNAEDADSLSPTPLQGGGGAMSYGAGPRSLGWSSPQLFCYPAAAVGAVAASAAAQHERQQLGWPQPLAAWRADAASCGYAAAQDLQVDCVLGPAPAVQGELRPYMAAATESPLLPATQPPAPAIVQLSAPDGGSAWRALHGPSAVPFTAASIGQFVRPHSAPDLVSTPDDAGGGGGEHLHWADGNRSAPGHLGHWPYPPPPPAPGGGGLGYH